MDAILIASKTIDYKIKKKVKEVLCKLDIKKVYDRVD